MIERLYVHNYRCLENFTLDLKGKGSALLIGKNGSGKSTVRHALKVLQDTSGWFEREGSWIDASDFTQSRTSEPMRFELDVVLDGKRISYVIAFRLPGVDAEPQVFEEWLTVDGNRVFSRKPDEVEWPNQQAGPFNPSVPALPIIAWAPALGPAYRFRTFLADMILLAPVPTLMSGFAEKDNATLRESGENFSATLNALLLRQPSAYRRLDDYLRVVMPDFDSFENIPRGESGTQLVVRFHRPEPARPFALEFKKLSDGEKCFFLAALVLALNQVTGPVFCFWDEPDNHLSLPEVDHFVANLRRMANRGGQFVATSHHPSAIRAFADENTFVLRRASHMEPPVIRTLEEIGYKGDLISALIRDEVL